MSTLNIAQIDAFSDQAYGGNPCAVIFDADDLTSEQMQAIALEMNLSETAFLMKSKIADFRARYFTPAEEIPLAGHPTISCGYALWKSGLVGKGTFRLQLEAGTVEVTVDTAIPDKPLISMKQLKPQFLSKHDPARVLPVFGLTPHDLLEDAVIQTVSTGTPMMMIPLRSHDSLRVAAMDFDAYDVLKAEGDFFSPHLFVLQGISEEATTFARHFGIPPDTVEDPFTGSATGSMSAYLWKHGLIEEPRFIAEQGHWMKRPGRAIVEVIGPRENIEAVKISGYAVDILRGEIDVPPI
ncbi:MAG: PhzF family phenazine biosynthesis protein [Calditrichia bacterium]